MPFTFVTPVARRWDSSAPQPFQLSYHWLLADEDIVVNWEGLRTPFPVRVAPGVDDQRSTPTSKRRLNLVNIGSCGMWNRAIGCGSAPNPGACVYVDARRRLGAALAPRRGPTT